MALLAHFAAMEVVALLVLPVVFVLCLVCEAVVSSCYLGSAPRWLLVEKVCLDQCAH